MSLPPDLVEVLSAFADSNVRYLVIGGHAVSLHARPRTTKDRDQTVQAVETYASLRPKPAALAPHAPFCIPTPTDMLLPTVRCWRDLAC